VLVVDFSRLLTTVLVVTGGTNGDPVDPISAP